MRTNNTRYSANGTDAPILLGVKDWNEEWMRLQDMRRKEDDARYWNERSKTFDTAHTASPYVKEFLARADIAPGSTVLDMGCGTGSIALPLAQAGCTVIAADFSDMMLAEVKRRAESLGVEGVSTLCMSWEDDWEEQGLGENAVDVVIASRSLSVRDLAAALDKMNTVASQRCVATMSSGCSPRMDARILKACGLEQHYGRDYQYAFNILTNKGYAPSCSFIVSERKDTYDSHEEAFAELKRMIHDMAHLYTQEKIDAAYGALRSWLDDNLVPNEEAGEPDEKGSVQKSLRLRVVRSIPWAFLSWNSSSAGF